MAIKITEYTDRILCYNTETGSKNYFHKEVDLQLAKSWLTAINQLSSYDKKQKIYSLFLYEGYSLWPFIQYSLFEALKQLSCYRSLLEFLVVNSDSEVDLSDCSVELKQQLSFLVSQEVKKNVFKKIKQIIKQTLTKLYFKSILVIWHLYSIFSPKSILLFTTDIIDTDLKCDFRFAKVYKLLYNNNFSFHEIFHTTGALRAIKMWGRHRRVNISLDWQKCLINLMLILLYKQSHLMNMN